jgi:LysM repeat protein
MINVYKENGRNHQAQSMLFVFAFVFCLLASFLFVTAALGSGLSGPVNTSSFTYEKVTVQKGDTLWTLAAQINQNIDTGSLVRMMMKYNNLHSTYIQPGQVIYVPVK